jgi:hypothetical protein
MNPIIQHNAQKIDKTTFFCDIICKNPIMIELMISSMKDKIDILNIELQNEISIYNNIMDKYITQQDKDIEELRNSKRNKLSKIKSKLLLKSKLVNSERENQSSILYGIHLEINKCKTLLTCLLHLLDNNEGPS